MPRRVLPWAHARPWASGDEYDLADVLPLVNEAVRLGGPLERERSGDHRVVRAGGEPFDKRFHQTLQSTLALPPPEHVEAEHSLVLIEDHQALPPRHRGRRHRGDALEQSGKVAL